MRTTKKDREKEKGGMPFWGLAVWGTAFIAGYTFVLVGLLAFWLAFESLLSVFR